MHFLDNITIYQQNALFKYSTTCFSTLVLSAGGVLTAMDFKADMAQYISSRWRRFTETRQANNLMIVL